MPLPTATLPNGRQVMLGRIKPKARPLTLHLANYLDLANAIPPPDSVDYSAKAMASLKHMYLNDTYGDCTIAAVYHMAGLWTANANGGNPAIGTDAEVLAAYRIFSPHGDNGAVISQVLDYFQSTGYPFSGVNHKIAGYVAVDSTVKLLTQIGIYLFGSIDIGINLPEAWMESNSAWDVPTTRAGSRIVGGHSIPAVAYNSTGVVISTWGGLRTITWAAFLSQDWVDEAYIPLSPDWTANANLSPTGLEVAALQSDLTMLGAGTAPPLVPDPPDPPMPPPIPTPGPGPTPSPTGAPTLAQVQAAIAAALTPLW